jgi:hypothetical protein
MMTLLCISNPPFLFLMIKFHELLFWSWKRWEEKKKRKVNENGDRVGYALHKKNKNWPKSGYHKHDSK